jgi:macrolide-specific efflux system membrane fusion protein
MLTQRVKIFRCGGWLAAGHQRSPGSPGIGWGFASSAASHPRSLAEVVLRPVLGALAACLLLAATAAAHAADVVEVPGMVLKLVEEVDVPAREAGVLNALNASEGQAVDKGFLLAQIDDAEARIAVEAAKIELTIAKTKAENDVNVRFSKKSVEVAKAELARSLESIKRFPKSISESEMDRLRLLVEKGTLEVEQAEHDFTVAGLARHVKANELQSVEQKAANRRVLAPIKGVVVQIQRHQGEWVKPGDTVLRILRLDRLRAEGYIKAKYLGKVAKGREVRLTVELPQGGEVKLPGKIVFLDPQIEPVNAQLRVWAEFSNPDLQLLPGMRAKMTIDGPRP